MTRRPRVAGLLSFSGPRPQEGRTFRWQRLDADAAWPALDARRRLGMTRYRALSLLDRIWELRDNPSAYDATYVALAELLAHR